MAAPFLPGAEFKPRTTLSAPVSHSDSGFDLIFELW